MMTTLPFVVQGAQKSLAESALPGAQTVYEAERTPRPSLVSRVLRRR